MKNKILILMAVVSTLTFSCSKWLDVTPGTEKTAKTMFESYQGYKDALIGCYMKMSDRSLYGDKLTMTTIEYLAQHWDLGDGHYGTKAKSIKKWDYQEPQVKDEFLSIYSSLYNVVIQANSILKALPITGSSVIFEDDARSIIEGEALGIRALCHFEVLRMFGQLPSGASKMVSLPYSYDVSTNLVNHYSYTDFVARVEADLLAAEKLLEVDPFISLSLEVVNGIMPPYDAISDAFFTHRNLRMNYWAIKSIQARFYLYTGQKEKAFAAAKIVIDAKNPDGKEKFALMKATNKMPFANMHLETIFQVSIPKIAEYVQNIFTPNDNAYLNHYMSPDKLASEYMYGTSVSASTNSRYKYLWNHEYTSMWGDPTPLLLKYDQSIIKPTSQANYVTAYKEVVPVIRISEIYLIAMECGDLATTNALYDKYRRARDITGTIFASEEEVMKMIYREYRCELIGEGQMFYLYKRMKATMMPWTEDPNTVVTENDYIIPLPSTEYAPNN